ncbi:MAG: protein kinase [Myxococcota bacterium]|nr:protein kinase [Myxococcota bacterium]
MSEYQRGSEVAGRFVILERIGEGGMGAVYKALQTSLDREVALKVLHSRNAFTPRARRRFAREARAIARLNHPHIAGVFDFGIDESEESLWLAMEFIDGEGMTGMKRESIDLMRLFSLTDQILSALSAAHAREIIHRDLKPSNIMITRDDDGREIIKLVDFGLAATQTGDFNLSNVPMDIGEEDPEGDRVILGTPRYMAPEIFKRAPVDPRVDLYALGVILFEILAGTPPYPGDDPRQVMRGHLREPIPQLQPRDGITIPAEFEACIYRLLAKDPVERFQNASEVREVLVSLIAEFSYVPWMTMGPGHDVSNFNLAGNISQLGFISGFGGQTIAPASMMLGNSKFGAQGQIAPLVARGAERRVLEEHLRGALRQGLGSLILLDGEAGIGKSRLVQWVRVRVEEAGVMRVAQGNYTRALGGFSGMRESLEQLLGTIDRSPDDAPYVIERKLLEWEFTRDEAELVIRLLRPPGDENAFGDDGAERSFSDQERVFAVVERILRRSATDKPLLLILEDLHDAGELTISFLEHLAVGLHLTPAPIVLVASMRSEELEQVPRLKDAMSRLMRFGSNDIVRLHLKRLAHDETVALARKLLPLDDMLAERISERSGGNPLHVTQIIRFLQESNKLTYDSGMWKLAEGVELTREIPDEIADMMRYRASQACRSSTSPEATRAILERAAILGRDFDYKLLRQLITDEPGEPWLGELDQVLEDLVRQGLLREVGYSGEDILEFEHAMMRDVLLQDLRAKRSQRQLHRLAAEAKIKRWGDHIGARALEIAQHYQYAKNPRGVYKFTLKAARQSLAACDLKTAMRLFRRAEEIAEAVEAAPNSGELSELEEASVVLRGDQVALEVAHLERRLGEYDSARQDYRKLLGSESGEIALWARWGLGDLAMRQGEFDEATSWFEASRRDAMRALQFPSSDIRDAVASLVDAYCLYGLGNIDFLRGDLSASHMTLGEALDKAQNSQEKLLETEVLRALAEIAWRRGEADRAELYRRRAVLTVERFGDVEERALMQLNTAEFLSQSGQPSDAEARAKEAIDSFEELGKRHYVAHSLLLLGKIAQGRGANKDAAESLRKAHRFYEMFRDRRGLTECKYHLADLAFAIRRFPDTQSLVRDALEGYRAMGARRGEARCWMLVGRLERELGKLDKSERTFAEAARTFSDLGDLRLAIVANLMRALVLDEAGHHEDADAIIDDVRSLLPGYAPLIEAMATVLELLSDALASRRPEISLEFDGLHDLVAQRLGRS